MQVRLSQAERGALDTYLGQHSFIPMGAGLAKIDGQMTTSAAIAQKAHDEAMPQSRVDLIKSDLDRRIMNAALWGPTPPTAKPPQTLGGKIEDLFTRKPAGDAGQQLPPSAAPNRDDLNKTTVTPIPGDQSMFKRAGIPAVPSQTPDIPLPQAGKDSRLFHYEQLQDRYATGTAIAFGITAPDGFWKQPGIKKVVLLSGGAATPIATQAITRDGQIVTWPGVAAAGTYTVMVTVNDQPQSGSSRNIQVYKPAGR